MPHFASILQKLIVATRNGNTAKVKRLIRGSAPINWQDDTGNTSLHMASAFGKTDIVELFIRSKADVNIANKSKNTPLMFAAFNNKMFIVRVLVEAGADAITLGDESKDAARWANYGDGTGTISEYLTNEAVHIRFHRSARDETNQLRLAKGRSLRAFERDLKEIVNFDDHMLHRLKHFCVGKRP